MPRDLHVLSLPLAFILSQDQTLRCLCSFSFFSFVLGLSLVSFQAGQELYLIGAAPRDPSRRRTPLCCFSSASGPHGNRGLSCGIMSLSSLNKPRTVAPGLRMQNYYKFIPAPNILSFFSQFFYPRPDKHL